MPSPGPTIVAPIQFGIRTLLIATLLSAWLFAMGQRAGLGMVLIGAYLGAVAGVFFGASFVFVRKGLDQEFRDRRGSRAGLCAGGLLGMTLMGLFDARLLLLVLQITAFGCYLVAAAWRHWRLSPRWEEVDA